MKQEQKPAIMINVLQSVKTKRKGIAPDDLEYKPLTDIVSICKGELDYFGSIRKVKAVRSEQDEDRRKKLKNKLPCFRVGYSNTGFNSIIPIDSEFEQSRVQRQSVILEAVSSSGNPLKKFLLVLVKQQFVSEAEYVAGADKFQKMFGPQSNERQKNPDRVRYFTVDPDLYYNPDAEPFDLDSIKYEEQAEGFKDSDSKKDYQAACDGRLKPNNSHAVGIYSHLRLGLRMSQDKAKEEMQKFTYDSNSLPEQLDQYITKWENKFVQKNLPATLKLGGSVANVNPVTHTEPAMHSLYDRLEELKTELEGHIGSMPKLFQLAAKLSSNDPGAGIFAALVLKSFCYPRVLIDGKPLCLQGIISGKSASGKESIFDILHKPLTVIQDRLDLEYIDNYDLYNQLDTKDKKGNEPTQNMVMTGWDFSTIALQLILKVNRVVIISPDLNGFLSGNKDWQALDNTFLNLYDGKAVPVVRSGERRKLEKIDYKNPQAAVLGFCTPSTVSDWMSKTGGGGNGLLGRMPVYYNRSTKFNPDVEPIDIELVEQYLKQALLEIPEDVYIRFESDIFGKSYERFNCSTKEVVLAVYERYVRDDQYDEKADLSSMINRFRILVLRLTRAAGLTQVEPWVGILAEILFVGQLITWESITVPVGIKTKAPNRLDAPIRGAKRKYDMKQFAAQFNQLRKTLKTKTEIGKAMNLSRSTLNDYLVQSGIQF